MKRELEETWSVLRSHPFLFIGLVVSVVLQIIGVVLFDYAIAYYDKVMHFLIPFFGAPLLYLRLVKSSIQRLTGSIPETIFTTFLFGATAAALWEIFEFAIDPFSPIPWQPSNQDTMFDMIIGIVGSIAGGALLAVRRLQRKS